MATRTTTRTKKAAKKTRATARKPGPRKISDSHKKAMADGRVEAAAIANYIQTLDALRPKRGRRRSPEAINKQLALIETSLPTAPPLKRVDLLQKQIELRTEAAQLEAEPDIEAAEEDFVKYAGSYSARKGISYAAWQALGVPTPVLRRAGLSRTRV